MRTYTRRVDLFLDRAWSLLDTWYSWGGDDPAGFDCSGTVIECGKSVGLFPRKSDYTAEGIYQMFKQHTTQIPAPGCLMFRKGSNGKMVHVEIVIAVIDNITYTIGASGGTSKTKTREDAIRDNAFIKVRPAADNLTVCVNPFWS